MVERQRLADDIETSQFLAEFLKEIINQAERQVRMIFGLAGFCRAYQCSAELRLNK